MVLLTKKKGAGTGKEVSLKKQEGAPRGLPSGTLGFHTGVQWATWGKPFSRRRRRVLAPLCVRGWGPLPLWVSPGPRETGFNEDTLAGSQ